MLKFLLETVVLIVLAVTGFFVYYTYGDDIKRTLFEETGWYTVYIGEVALDVTVADEEHERIAGLSGTRTLGDFEGKLFIFDTNDRHGIWMKDMFIPIDIIWIDEDLKVIHIEENVLPSSYPSVFAPDQNARFVIETNAFFVDAVKIKEGDQLTLPPTLLPEDVRRDLSL